MDDAALERFLADMESDRVERKASVSDRGTIRQAICAFANDMPNHGLPGVIFIGVNDDGSCANLPVTDQLLQTLADMRSDGNTLPLPTMTVQKRTLAGCEMAVVIVQPSDAPPVRYNGRVWIRVGPRRATATREDERRLSEKRRAKDLPFDVQPVRSATMADLDLDLFARVYLSHTVAADVIEENQRATVDQVAALRFASPEPDAVPTVLGVLAIARDPRQFIACDYVQFLRIDGNELGDPIKDQKEIDGPLIEILDVLDTIINAHVKVETDIVSRPTEQRHPDYPVVAVQQLARNAILHRTYEGTHAPVRIYWFNDRIEIHNPGGPFGHVTRLNFGQPGIADYRNLHLAEVMRNLGYVQKFGFGIPLARQACQKNGNPPPEFTVEESHVLATLRSRP